MVAMVYEGEPLWNPFTYFLQHSSPFIQFFAFDTTALHWSAENVRRMRTPFFGADCSPGTHQGFERPDARPADSSGKNTLRRAELDARRQRCRAPNRTNGCAG